MAPATVLTIFVFLVISGVQQTHCIAAPGGVISLSNYMSNSTEEGGVLFFMLTREGSTDGNISFEVTLTHITTEPADFSFPISHPMIFSMLDGRKEILFRLLFEDDTLVEGTEEFTVTLTGGNATAGEPSQATGYVRDNDFSSTQWSEWADNGTCSTSCGSGSQMQSRTRNCTGSCPSNFTIVEMGTVTCMNCACPVISEWTEWADKRTCSTTCGQGLKIQERTRSCTNSTCCPSNFTSSETRTVDCEICTCPVIGPWCHWADSGQCSVTCGGGTKMQARTRECTNPCTPSDCVTREERTVSCNCYYPCRGQDQEGPMETDRMEDGDEGHEGHEGNEGGPGGTGSLADVDGIRIVLKDKKTPRRIGKQQF